MDDQDVRGGHHCYDHQWVDLNTRTGSGHCGICHEREPVIETAVVFNKAGQPIFWHEPPGRSGGALPDSRNLWDILWDNRHDLGGVAHTHPWHGEAWPSGTDLTTFAAIEAGLGTKLLWPIVTFSEVRYFLAQVIWRVDEVKTLKYIEANMSLSEISKFVAQDVWKQNIDKLRVKSQHGGCNG